MAHQFHQEVHDVSPVMEEVVPVMEMGHHHGVENLPPLDLSFNPFTCWLFILCGMFFFFFFVSVFFLAFVSLFSPFLHISLIGITIPLGIRLTHCRSVSKSSLGTLMNFGSACTLLLGLFFFLFFFFVITSSFFFILIILFFSGTAAWTLNAMFVVVVL